MFPELSPRLNLLYYQLKHDDITDRFTTIKNQYKLIKDKLFNLPETRERNFGIIVAYMQMIRDMTEFIEKVDYLGKYFFHYKFRVLGEELKREASASKICKRDLSRVVNGEWTKHIGTLREKEQILDSMWDKIKKYPDIVRHFSINLEQGIATMDESLGKKEEEIACYERIFGQATSDLSDLTRKRDEGKVDYLMFRAELYHIVSRLDELDSKIVYGNIAVRRLSSWLKATLRNSKSEEVKQELWMKFCRAKIMEKKIDALFEKLAELSGNEAIKHQSELALDLTRLLHANEFFIKDNGVFEIPKG